MPDQKPPRVAGDERATLQALLQYHRDSLVRKVDGVSDADARWSPVASGTSLLWLVRHVARAELLWVPLRFAGEDVELAPDAVTDDDTVAAAVAHYRATWSRVDRIIAASGLDDLCRRNDRDEPTDLRWVVAHLLEETARHAGHADIIRELLDGGTGR